MDDDLVSMELKFKLMVSDRPWEHEPNSEEWVDEATGYKCLIWRHPTHGSLNGYVTIPRKHPLHGQNYDEINHFVDVHGGLTYSHAEKRGKWTVGFDCNHAEDFAPKMVMSLMKYVDSDVRHHLHETYRDWAYVKAEVEKLAQQLKQLEVKEK